MLKHKKFLTAMMIFIVATLVASGCSESDKSVAPVNDTYHEFTDDNGKTYSYDTADPEFITAKAQSESLEKWVERMDLHVTENKDGTYLFDEEAFISEHGVLSGADEKTVESLQEGVSIINQKIRDTRQSGVAMKITLNYYWWGYKYCYSEYTAVVMLDWMSRSGYAYPLYFWANYNYYYYGRFCMNHTWAGGIWITNS